MRLVLLSLLSVPTFAACINSNPKPTGEKGELCGASCGASSFDLRPLRVGIDSPYRVKDLIDSVERNYTYVFNVCDDAAVPSRKCEETLAGSGPAPAFQVFGDGSCVRLSGSTTTAKYSLLDEDDPTQGVALTYFDGDPCHFPGNVTVRREFTIKFKCSESWGKIPDTRVEESLCKYDLMFETVYGCPIQCPFVNRKLCGGVGFCGMDDDAQAPRCFCNEGLWGPDCTLKLSDKKAACDGTCVALILMVILLVVLLVAGFVILHRAIKMAKMNVKFGTFDDSINGEENLYLTRAK
jgi:hypothetical protein